MKYVARQQSGYVALITVAIMMSAVIVTGVAITLLLATGLITTYTYDQGQRAFYVADSCGYEALLRIEREGTSYIGSHTMDVGNDTCTIDVSAGSGTEVDVEISGSHDEDAYRPIYMVVETNPFSLVSWQETQ